MTSLVILLVAAMAYGSGGNEPQIVEITHMVGAADGASVDDGWFISYVNKSMESLGIAVDAVSVPLDRYSSAVQTMLESDSAPDVMWERSLKSILKWTKEGRLLDYGPYLEEFGTNLLQLYSPTDLIAGQFWCRQSSFRGVHNRAEHGPVTFVRQDYLDILGMKLPVTIDEVETLAVMMKNNAEELGQDPSRFYPIAADNMWSDWARWLLSAFVSERPPLDAMVVPPILWPEAREAFRWLNMLYNKSLMPDPAFDTRGFFQMIVNGEVGIVPWCASCSIAIMYGSLYQEMRNLNPEAKLVPIFPWRRSGQAPYHNDLLGSAGYGRAFISPATTQHPQEVVQYLDYISSESGRRTMNLGIEDEDWESTSNGKIRRLIDDEEYVGRVASISRRWGVIGPASRSAPDNAEALYGTNPYAEEYIDWIRSIQFSYPAHRAPVFNLPSPESDRYYDAIEADFWSVMPTIVTAPIDQFDALFERAIADYRKNGGDRIEQEAIANLKWDAIRCCD